MAAVIPAGSYDDPFVPVLPVPVPSATGTGTNGFPGLPPGRRPGPNSNRPNLLMYAPRMHFKRKSRDEY